MQLWLLPIHLDGGVLCLGALPRSLPSGETQLKRLFQDFTDIVLMSDAPYIKLLELVDLLLDRSCNYFHVMVVLCFQDILTLCHQFVTEFVKVSCDKRLYKPLFEIEVFIT